MGFAFHPTTTSSYFHLAIQALRACCDMSDPDRHHHHPTQPNYSSNNSNSIRRGNEVPSIVVTTDDQDVQSPTETVVEMPLTPYQLKLPPNTTTTAATTTPTAGHKDPSSWSDDEEEDETDMRINNIRQSLILYGTTQLEPKRKSKASSYSHRRSQLSSQLTVNTATTATTTVVDEEDKNGKKKKKKGKKLTVWSTIMTLICCSWLNILLLVTPFAITGPIS